MAEAINALENVDIKGLLDARRDHQTPFRVDLDMGCSVQAMDRNPFDPSSLGNNIINNIIGTAHCPECIDVVDSRESNVVNDELAGPLRERTRKMRGIR